jgi:hypothetical protein
MASASPTAWFTIPMPPSVRVQQLSRVMVVGFGPEAAASRHALRFAPPPVI